jgi:uncharacterized protein YlzI (FlbEa/FlbD family)
MITLTTPDGEKIQVNPSLIGSIRLNRIYDPRAKSVITIAGLNQAVQETEQQIKEMI